MSMRAQPFYCPYCGEQDVRPGEEEHVYHCRTCDRRWRLAYEGLGAVEAGRKDDEGTER